MLLQRIYPVPEKSERIDPTQKTVSSNSEYGPGSTFCPFSTFPCTGSVLQNAVPEIEGKKAGK